MAVGALFALRLLVLKNLNNFKLVAMKFEFLQSLVGELLDNKMNIKRIKGWVILGGGSVVLSMAGSVSAQVADQGLSPASNTYRSYQDASLARDSNLNRPLDLLNDFYPALSVTISDNQNVRRRTDFDEDDLKIVATPSLAYRTNLGRHQFYAAYTGTYTFHQDLTQEDAEAHVLNASLGLDLTRRWDLDLFASYGDSFEERGISGSRAFNQFNGGGIDSGPESIEYVRYGADLIFGRKIGVVTAVLGYEYVESGFNDGDLFNGNESNSRDRESESVHFDLNWNFAASTSLFGRVEYTDIDYDFRAPNLDSDETSYLLGLRFKPANAISGVVSAGRTDRDFDDFGREGFSGSTYYLNLNYSITPFSNIGFSASRFVEEPGDENASFYESELFGLSLNHALSPKFSFDAYAKLVDDDYDIGREDQFIDWGIGIDYAWRSWLGAGIYYGEIERDSNIEGLDYDDQFIGIRLRSDLRSLLQGRGKQRREPDSFGNLKRN